MVLSYFNAKKSSPLILDNLSFKILTLHQRVDLEALLFINNTGVYKINEQNKLYKVAQRYKEFEQLKRKIAKNL